MNVNANQEAQTPKISNFLILLGLGIVFFDQATKILSYLYLPAFSSYPYAYPYGGIGVFHNVFGVEFSLNYMTNVGAAWGLFGDYQLLLVFLRICLIFGLIVYLLWFNKKKIWQVPLILIIAGAIGNVTDFFVYGHVIDMFHFVLRGFDFPIFNIADTAISLGIAALFILSFLRSPV